MFSAVAVGARVFALAAVAALSYLLFWLALLGVSGQSDYQREWGLRKQRLNEVVSKNASLLQAFDAVQLYWLTGRPRDHSEADRLLQAALHQYGDNEELQYLEAKWLAYHHQPAAAARYLINQQSRFDDPGLVGLYVDVALQQGRIQDAETALREILSIRANWALWAQQAFLLDKSGLPERADQAYEAAEDLVSSKSMRDFAWLELQRGYLALKRGKAETAKQHYRQAMRAYSGYWLVIDFWAEWLATQRNFNTALALYRKLAVCTQRPEIYQTLGDLYLFLGYSTIAKAWHDKALNHYLQSVARGETQYYHHLASLYADAYFDGAAAIKWAQRDLSQRSNALTHDALAWALFRDGQFQEAVSQIRKALSFHWEDAHLYAHAGMIFLAAGLSEDAHQYLLKAKRINPHYDAFHVHR